MDEPVWRHDPLTGRWVVLARSRRQRPHQPDRCPLCPGREHETPPELWADRPEGIPDGPGWRVRALPNRFPLFVPDGPARGPESGHPAVGHHEVIVHSPDHDASLATADLDAVVRTVRGWRLRHLALRAAGWAFVQTSVNHGPESGASLAHPHSQIIAVPFIPERIEREAEAMDDACLLCRLGAAVDDELIVSETPLVRAFCPVWSRSSYEVLVIPRQHEVRFEESDHALIEQTAALLHDVCARLRSAIDDPPYTMVLHTAPRNDPGRFHWHVHIWPRRSSFGPVELGMGLGVCSVDPVEATAELRDVAGDLPAVFADGSGATISDR